MPIVRYRPLEDGQPHLGLLEDDRIYPFPEDSGFATMQQVLQRRASEISDLVKAVRESGTDPLDIARVKLLVPLDEQEVWAAGVTYKRSRDARMEESTEKSVYDRIYDADRPEIFLKATPRRVAGPGGTITIRSDSGWDVPEPEMALVLNRHGEIVGYTVGNDVSSRSIEGENPLYLPQAKIYAGSAALGPVVALADELENPGDLAITLTIERDDSEVFRGETSTADLHRKPADLASWLFRGNDFPDGAFLMTGTGIVPPDEFTLREGDIVRIEIAGIGILTNRVAVLDVGS